MKKIFLLCMVAMLLLSMNVSASVTTSKSWAETDFTRPEGAGDDWKPEGWTIGGMGGNASSVEQALGYVHRDGYAVLCRRTHTGAGANSAVYQKVTGVPSDFTIMFDILFANEESVTGANTIISNGINGYAQMMYGVGTVPVLKENGESETLSTGKPEVGIWYSYVFQVSGNRMSIYRKKAGEGAFTKIVNNRLMQVRTTNELSILVAGNETAMIYVDNVKLFSGTYFTDAEITVSESRIQGTMHIETEDVEPALNGETATKAVTPVLTAFDGKRKLLDVEFGADNIKFDKNKIEIAMDISPEVYENMHGGSVELYVCDAENILKPLTAAYTISIQE